MKAQMSPLMRAILNNPKAREQLIKASLDRTRMIEFEGKRYMISRHEEGEVQE